MFLRSLTIKGFKSFADAATLGLEPGVTVVVGPNGSGKSNVVDAIAWVLGAQAPSAVRSTRMDDVIFAGTARRPALGRAEVTLTLDNSARLLPIELTEVTVRRTLFRTGDSEYAINGAPCRLLDVQELLSDAGVGRQQHVIVSQGQIDAVLNARPEDRRSIIEEAAGVLKFRKRKEKAERRLEGTEGNLTRVQDLLREVRRQLRPLERQAEAARRHDELTTELRALRAHLAGREIAGLRSRLEALATATTATTGEEATARRALAVLDAEVVAAEAELDARGGFDLGDALARAEQLRERARGLAAVLAERRRSLDRARAALLATGATAALEDEAATTGAALAEIEAAVAQLGPDADELAATEAELAAERTRLVTHAPTERPAERAAVEARGEIRALRTAVERGAAELARAEAAERAAAERASRLAAERSMAQRRFEDAEAERVEAEGGATAADAARADAEAALERAESQRRAADHECSSWSARAEALTLALDEARVRAGADALAGIAGGRGVLVELVEVDPGWEAAFEAAAGDALAAVVVDAEAAPSALAHLDETGVAGAIVALPESESETAPAPGRPGSELRRHVRASDPAVAALLDRLLGRVHVAESWRAALARAHDAPDAVVVTATGDRFGPASWRIGAPTTGATRAALDEATEAATTARRQLEGSVAAAREAAERLAVARRAEADATQRRARASADATAAGEQVARLADEASTDEAPAASALDELRARVGRERARLAELDGSREALERDEAAEQAAARAAAAARARLEERGRAVAALRRDLEVRAAGLEERRRLLHARRTDLERRLAVEASARAEAGERRVQLERTLGAVDRLDTLLAGHAGALDADLADLAERRRRQSDAARAVGARLDGLRRQRSEAEAALEAVRERQRRIEVEHAELAVRLEAAVEGLRRDLDLDPDAAVLRPCPPLPDATSAPARARELERELRLLGPVNPLALEEFTALHERHTFLEAQLDDVKATRRELLRVIRGIDGEIQSTFAAAYADVSGHFATLFATLFPGGVGRLTLTAPDDLLATGVEVEAKPSGKNVKKLSLLSGGERSLTALAFLFAVFRARPSPFYVMDEVEAALDDVNLHRFLGLLAEFRRDAQLIVVSHQKRTMEAADCLFGVTMQPGGSSKVVSERIATPA